MIDNIFVGVTLFVCWSHKHTYEHTRTLKSLVWLWPSQFSDLFIGTLIRCLFLILNCRSLEPPSQICPFHLSILLIDHFHRYWSRTEQTSPHHNKLINLIQSSNDDHSRPTKINKITKCYDTIRYHATAAHCNPLISIDINLFLITI